MTKPRPVRESDDKRVAAFWYRGTDPIPHFSETMEDYHERVRLAREQADGSIA